MEGNDIKLRIYQRWIRTSQHTYRRVDAGNFIEGPMY